MNKNQLDKFTKVFRRIGELRKEGLRTKQIDKVLSKEFKVEGKGKWIKET